MTQNSPNQNVASRLEALLKTAGARLRNIEILCAINGLIVTLAMVVKVTTGWLNFVPEKGMVAIFVIGLLIVIVSFIWQYYRTRRAFLDAFRTQSERLEAARSLSTLKAKAFPRYPIRELGRIIGLFAGGCSCSQCGRSVRRLTPGLECKRCKVKLPISGYHCPICGGSAYIKTAKQVVKGYFETPKGGFVESGAPRNRKVYGMASGAIANAGVSAIASGIEKLLVRLWKLLARFVKWLFAFIFAFMHRDVLSCSCGETWGVPLAREGRPFPDGLPRMNRIPESK